MKIVKLYSDSFHNQDNVERNSQKVHSTNEAIERNLSDTTKQCQNALCSLLVPLCDNGVQTVSYTHLDVYKRQPCGIGPKTSMDSSSPFPVGNNFLLLYIGVQSLETSKLLPIRTLFYILFSHIRFLSALIFYFKRA